MEDLAKFAVDRALKFGAEYSDVRIENAEGTNIVVMDAKTKTMSAQHEFGCGLRAFVGGAWGFSSANQLTKASLKDAAESAVKMAKAASSKAKTKYEIKTGKPVKARDEYKCKEPPSDVSVEEKVSFVLSLDKSMRTLDSRISSSNARYDDLEVN